MKHADFKQKRCRHTVLKTVLFLAFIFSFTLQTVAQVTIGSGEQPVSGALLQLKDKENVTDGTFNASKGLALPRVTLSDKHELYPMFLQNPEDLTSGPNADYAANKSILDKSHTGLIVYNLVEDDDKELCLGLNQWDGEQWNCFESKMGNAKFDLVSCSDITVGGVYVEGTATTSMNYLSINLNVAKPGAFTITATSGNGYSFYLSGVALSRGGMTVNVPCQGTPIAVQTDKLTFSGIDLVAGCEPEVEVSSAVAGYSLNCSSIVVNGQYVKGTVLTSYNTITLNVTVTTSGSYNISTPLTNGIRFSASGNFTVGTQPVTLIGSGTPTVNVDFPVTINVNTQQGNGICSATVPMTLPAMTYAIIGNGVWSWAATPRINALTNGGISFGPSGIVKIVDFSICPDWPGTGEADVTTAANRLNNNATKPDIVLYFAYNADPNTDITTALVNYINKGGCVIYGSADKTSTQVNVLLNGLFGISPAQAQIAGTGTTDDNDYLIANLPDDPIINGPFGNLSARYWGEDNLSTGSVIVTALPPNSVQICSANNPFGKTAVNPDYSIVWYNDSKNFVYFGDSTGADTNNTSKNDYPSSFTSSGLPQSKLYGNWPQPSGSPSQFVYNAALELNSVAWALKKAAISGINPH